MMKSQGFNYYSRQWGASIALFVGEWDAFTMYLRKRWHYRGENKNDPNLAALSFRLQSSKDGRTVAYVMWMPDFQFTTAQYETLAHETLHTATHILDDRNVDYSDDAKETLTYTFGDIYGSILKVIHYNWKKELSIVPAKKTDTISAGLDFACTQCKNKSKSFREAGCRTCPVAIAGDELEKKS